MSVIQITNRQIKCDFPGCGSVSALFPRAALARKYLLHRGWNRVEGIDFCADHNADAIDGYIKDRQRLREAS